MAHLILDGVPEKRLSRGELLEWLERMPAEIGMTGIAPAVVASTEQGPRPLMMSGFKLVAESHIKVEVDYRVPVMYVDIFTCKPFPEELQRHAEEQVTEGLSFGITSRLLLPRGLETLPPVGAALPGA